MNHLFVPYELALLAKEKGFDEPCLAYWNKEELLPFKQEINSVFFTTYIRKSVRISAPIYTQLMEWLNKKHKIIVDPIDIGFLEKIKFCFQFRVYNKTEALNAALTEAFKLIP